MTKYKNVFDSTESHNMQNKNKILNIQLTINENKEIQQIFTFKKLKLEHFLHFCVTKYFKVKTVADKVFCL